ncbi:hypothetical protein A3F64_00385 [Candidatus Saccharibacteria bacterium RIFCSPHIGHO2_12_FULL_42_8]|nr:MAG: hypothetical protein A3F64_00385 [Candidatus Saccharibacteria bacterium RIFCSPHIGHO2_12_FULL_42_8]
MKKDIIYIDTEDDITSIIEKVKASNEKIIALVPPKRVGVLQSAVNLKLLQKSASASDKRIVLITTSKPLASLAAGVAIPVAKNLQSKPELAAAQDLPEVDDSEEDVINGEDLPVGELEKSAPAKDIADDEEIELPEDLNKPTDGPFGKPKKTKGKKGGPNIPNFDTFRKKLFLAIGAGVLFIIFLIWAIWFAPHATVNIKAKTTTESINAPISLNASGTTDVDAKVIRPNMQQVKKTNSVDFDATGKKDIGEKATGTMQLTRTSVSSNRLSIPAGTGFSTGNFTFTSTEDASLDPTTVGPGGFVQDTTTVKVQAAAVGSDYNLSARNYQPTVSGFTAQGSSMSGGSKRTATVVSDSDIETAKAKIIEQNGDAGKKELEDKFDDKKYVIIDKSYKADPTTTTSSPASGAEASKAKLTVEITYSLQALSKDDINAVLNNALKEKLDGQKNQKIYDNGLSKLQFGDFIDTSVTLKTTGYVGPTIDTKDLKSQLVGKNYEDIRQKIKAIEGVEDVDTKFFPFWISSAPSEGKIEIKFDVQKND